MYVYRIQQRTRGGFGSEWYGFSESVHEIDREVAVEHKRFIGQGIVTIPTVYRIENVSNIDVFDPECVFATIEGSRAYCVA